VILVNPDRRSRFKAAAGAGGINLPAHTGYHFLNLPQGLGGFIRRFGFVFVCGYGHAFSSFSLILKISRFH
jgi:hypothetical protein